MIYFDPYSFHLRDRKLLDFLEKNSNHHGMLEKNSRISEKGFGNENNKKNVVLQNSMALSVGSLAEGFLPAWHTEASVVSDGSLCPVLIHTLDLWKLRIEGKSYGNLPPKFRWNFISIDRALLGNKLSPNVDEMIISNLMRFSRVEYIFLFLHFVRISEEWFRIVLQWLKFSFKS